MATHGRSRRDGAPAGRTARARLAAAGHAALTLLLGAGPTAAQGGPAEPPNLATFQHSADLLAAWASAPDRPPVAWGEGADRHVLWLADYATGYPADHPAVAARTLPVLRDAFHLLPRLPATARPRLVRSGLACVERLSQDADFERAHAVLHELVLPAATDAGAGRIDCLLKAAEVARRSFRWPESAHWLTAAADACAQLAPAAQDHVRVQIAVSRGLLQLERGLPDLAFGEVEAARAPAERTGTAADAWLVAFLELRLAYAVGRPQLARDVLQRVTTAHGTALEGPSLLRLRVRAAMTLLQEPAPPADDVATATAWLRDAAAVPQLWPDERRLALAHLVLHALTTGDHPGAAAHLAAAAALTRNAATVDERALALPALQLRHALDANLGDDVVRQRRDELVEVWSLVEARWADEPLQQNGLGPLFLVNRQRSLAELMRAAIALEPARDAAPALDLWLRSEQAGSLARAVRAPVPTLVELRERFARRDGGALVFATAPEHGFVLLLDGSGVVAHPLVAGTLAIDRASRELLRALAAARSDAAARSQLDAAARAVRDALLSPAVQDRLRRWRSVAIVGADMVGDVPFEFLSLDEGRLLGATHTIDYLPSLLVATWLDRERPVQPGDGCRIELLACPDATPVDPALAAQVQRLPWTDADGDDLRRPLAGRGELLVRAAAAATLAARATAPQATLLEVLAHGVRDESRIDPQGILLGDGRVAWPADFERAGLPRHVVFAACRAGGGRLRRGDDGRHLLSGSALLAGARAVVVPRLDVGYAAAKELLAALHRHLAAGNPFGEALRRARVDVGGATGEGSLEPFLFHLHGLGDAALLRPPDTTPTRLGPVAILAAGSLLVAAAMWRQRRRARQG